MNKLFTKTWCIALLAIALNGSNTYAQTVVNESFDYNPAGTTYPNIALPWGWSQIKVGTGTDPDNYWDRMNNTATLPACTPRTGVGMMRYRANLTTSLEKAALISRKFDMRGNAAGTTVSFWMYRDNEAAANVENLQVAWNSIPSDVGITLLAPILPATNPLNRPCASAPVVACVASYSVGNWYQYTYTIPNTINGASVYILLIAESRAGRNMYIDDFSIGTYPNNQSYIAATAATMSFQNTANVGQNSFNNLVAGIKITVDGEGNKLFCDSIGFNYNGCTSPLTDVVANSAKLWWTGGTAIFTPLAAQQHGAGVSIAGTNFYFYPTSLQTTTYSGTIGTPTITVASAAGLTIGMSAKGFGIANGAVIVGIFGTTITLSLNNTATAGAGTAGRFTNFFLHNGDNYFWLTYDVAPNPTSTPGNCIDAEFLGVELGAAVNATVLPVVQTIAGCREIDVVYCGGATPFYSVGTSWLGGSYTNNDYIHSVVMNGVIGYPNLNNGPPNNYFGPAIAPYFGGVAPFSNHPPDYELFSVDSPGISVTLQVSAQTTMNTTAGSNVIVVSSTINLSPGMYVSGPGIPAPSSPYGVMPVIVSIVGSNVTISANATLTQTLFTATGTFGGFGIFLQVGTWFSSNYIAAWIDFNKDGIFNNNLWTTPGGEKLGQSPSFTTNQSGTFYFQVPPTAFIGKNVLRVREIYATSNCDPCASATYGETEDYPLSIIGFCGIAGWKTWLGFTDDWATTSNWCPPGVPTIAQNVRIPATGGVGYTRPIIKAGIAAQCNKLRIEGADTLYIDAYKNGGLTANDSIYIKDPQGMLKVVSSYNATAVMGNGTLYSGNWTPLKGGFRNHKMQIVYTPAELLARGMVQGDVITQIKIPVTSLGVGTHTFTGLQVSYYYTNPFYCFTSPPVTAPIAAPGGIAFTGNVTAVVGDNTITLSSPITWVGGGNNLVIQICYSLPAAGVATERVEQTVTLGCRSVAYFGDLSLVTGGCALTGVAPQKVSSDQRPNLKFVFDRPYSKVPISLAGHWGNNGTFVPGYSKVTFNGTNPQNIAGTTNTSFYDLVINNSNASGVAQVTAASLIGDTLNLINGPLRLNGLTFTHNNNLPTSVIRTNGWLQSEDLPPNYGRFRWVMAGDLGAHVFPFGTASGAANYIPFTYDPTATSGTSDVSMATYYTIPANTPYPTGVPAILNFYTGLDNSANMVDRFWQIDNTGTGAIADLTFTFRTPAELAANGNTNPRAQRYKNPKWADPSTFIGQSNPSANQVLVPGVTQFSQWAITLEAQPLPITLLNFAAKKEKDKVRLDWSTASEINNDYFTVERTQNHSEFSFIDKVQSRGPSSSILEYYTYDYRPLNGLQYYRLKQTDFDGTSTYSKLVPITFGKENFEIITVTKESDDSKNVLFNYDADGALNIRLVDIMGKVVLEKLNFKATNGINQFNLNSNLVSGIYTIFIYDDSRSVSRKLIY